MNFPGTFLCIISLNMFISILPLKCFTNGLEAVYQSLFYCKFAHHICQILMGVSYKFDVFITRSLVKGLVKLDFIQSGMNDLKVPIFNLTPCKLFIFKLSVFQGGAITRLLAKLIYCECLSLLN